MQHDQIYVFEWTLFEVFMIEEIIKREGNVRK